MATAPLNYRHRNHVDSAIYSNYNGSNKKPHYTAFGTTRRGAVDTAYTYTDQFEDGTGLYYYNARYYDPNIGIFISPDSLIPDPTNVLDYNRYLYARGNPVKYIDPNGNATLTYEDRMLALPIEIGGGGGGGAALVGIGVATIGVIGGVTNMVSQAAGNEFREFFPLYPQQPSGQQFPGSAPDILSPAPPI